MSQAPPPIRPVNRVPPERFQLPVDRMREGYYSDKYFVHTRDVLAHAGRNPRVTMQVFQKQPAWLGGVDEAIAVLKTCRIGKNHEHFLEQVEEALKRPGPQIEISESVRAESWEARLAEIESHLAALEGHALPGASHEGEL